QQALRTFDPAHPAKVVPMLARGLYGTRLARGVLAEASGGGEARAEADFLLAIKERQFEEALQRAAGITLDPLADRETAVPGATVGVRVRMFLPDPAGIKVQSVTVTAPEGWTVTQGDVPTPASGSPIARFFREKPDAEDSFQIGVPAGAQ